ncbi:Uma2 family endonuclease [Streptomyces sp. NPDC017529]|uniref:Uma2 family endonuclease n=1 Tax=Streptomyces sp. NPDC017529 TaxID=3365000 RepID=UPI00379D9F98
MTAAMAETGRAPHGRPWDYLLQTWREPDVPEGWRAEIDEEQIVLVPPPHPHHNGIADAVQRLLYRVLPDDLGIYRTLGVHVAPLDKLYVPAKTDRTKKLWAYAHAPVPAYLLVDRFDEHGPTTSLFTEPQNGAYKHAERAPFGEAVELPGPFFGTLHTAPFPR